MTTGQASLTTAASKITTVSDRRSILCLVPTADCFVGATSAVTATTGHRLVANIPNYISPGTPGYASDTTAGDVYGVTASGTATVTFVEMTDQAA